jgi:CubicO group peptidase (beta-lactamase class C family)
MKVTQIIKIVVIAIVALVLIKVGSLAWLATGGYRTPARVPAPDYWPTDGWRASTPEEQGFDSAKIAEGVQSLLDHHVDIDSLMIIRNGYVVLDAHFAPYDGAFPHDLASATKSVMTTLIGIAADQGKLDLDQPVVSFFPDREIANLDERKAQMTVRHLVSNRNGMQSGCYEGDEPTIRAMTGQPDWVQAALDRPMVAEPGTTFCYDSPGMHLLSAILQEATGMTGLEFARQNLFAPLGIQQATWENDPQGYSRGWGDLHLLPEDLAKIGFLWLHRGSWDRGDGGEGGAISAISQVVSEAWVHESVVPRVTSRFSGREYGYGWWIRSLAGIQVFYAWGYGGQFIFVVPAVRTVVAVTSVADPGSERREHLDAVYDLVERFVIPVAASAFPQQGAGAL